MYGNDLRAFILHNELYPRHSARLSTRPVYTEARATQSTRGSQPTSFNPVKQIPYQTMVLDSSPSVLYKN